MKNIIFFNNSMALTLKKKRKKWKKELLKIIVQKYLNDLILKI
jgi:hypothetical protein